MVMGNNHDGNYNTETTDTHENGKNDDTMEKETNSNKLSIVAWNIRCNNKELPEVEKEAIKRQWDIVFISETGLISSKIGPPTTESQIYLQDYVSAWSSPTKSKLVKRWKRNKIKKLENKYKKQVEEEKKKKRPINKKEIKKKKKNE